VPRGEREALHTGLYFYLLPSKSQDLKSQILNISALSCNIGSRDWSCLCCKRWAIHDQILKSSPVIIVYVVEEEWTEAALTLWTTHLCTRVSPIRLQSWYDPCHQPFSAQHTPISLVSLKYGNGRHSIHQLSKSLGKGVTIAVTGSRLSAP